MWGCLEKATREREREGKCAGDGDDVDSWDGSNLRISIRADVRVMGSSERICDVQNKAITLATQRGCLVLLPSHSISSERETVSCTEKDRRKSLGLDSRTIRFGNVKKRWLKKPIALHNCVT